MFQILTRTAMNFRRNSSRSSLRSPAYMRGFTRNVRKFTHARMQQLLLGGSELLVRREPHPVFDYFVTVRISAPVVF
jgi:hypothetical protein